VELSKVSSKIITVLQAKLTQSFSRNYH